MPVNLNDPRNYDTPLFPLSVAAQCALTALPTVRMWFHRGRVKLHEMDAQYPTGTKGDRGMPTLLTLRTVFTLAAAAPLVKQGVDVSAAYRAAKAWTHLGAGWDGVGESPRDPAELFKPPHWTMLVYYGGEDARVVASEADGIGFVDLFPGNGGQVPPAPMIVFLNKVDMWVRGTCGGFLRP